jgi:hypothetical protein
MVMGYWLIIKMLFLTFSFPTFSFLSANRHKFFLKAKFHLY